MTSGNGLADFSADRLVAYVDGELDEETNAAIEAASATDPALAEEIALLRSGRAILATAFNQPLKEAVPDALRRDIEAGFAARRQAASKTAGRRVVGFGLWPALASVAAALVIFLGGGYVAEQRAEREIARLERLNAANRALIRRTVAEALETQESGTHVEWHNPAATCKANGAGSTWSPARPRPVRQRRSDGGASPAGRAKGAGKPGSSCPRKPDPTTPTGRPG
jgi:anti-sigma factor RsiW